MIDLDALFGRMERAGIEGALGAMTRGADTVAGRAKELAPVRKVFEGQDAGYRTRLKTMAEIKADRAVRAQLGLGPENPWVYPPSTVARRAPQMLGQRRLASPGRLASARAQRSLDARGRYELASGRSVHALASGGDQLGGRLRDEIYATSATLEGRMIRARVVSPTPYAKHQEMGTRHNPAHPYMRPAAHESRGSIKADVVHSVAAGVREAARGVHRAGTITVRL